MSIHGEPAENSSNGDNHDIIDRFFEQVRQVSLGERESIDFSTDQMAEIAGDISLATKFCCRFNTFSQDPEAKEVIIEIFRKLAIEEEVSVASVEGRIGTIDIYFGRISGAATIGGTGALLYGAVAAGTVTLIGPAALAVGGLVGLGTCAYSRTRFLDVKSRSVLRQRQFEQMVVRLEKKGATDGQ